MSIEIIKKRNGQMTDFDRTRIEVAIAKASSTVEDEVAIEDIPLLVDAIVANIEAEYIDTTPDVESVQDHVERELMRSGHYNTVRAYIIYRERHKGLRAEVQAESAEKLEASELRVIKYDGSTEFFSYSRLIKDLIRAAHGLEDRVDVDELAQVIKTNLYDGIPVTELVDSMIMAAKAYIERDGAYSQLASRLLRKKIYQEVLDVYENDDPEAAHHRRFAELINQSVKLGLLDKRVLQYDLDALATAIKPERDDLLEYMGLHMLYDRYLLRSEGRVSIVETPQMFWMRIAMGTAMVEGPDKKTKTKRAIEFYEILSTLRYVTSSPTLFNAGTNFHQLSSCFLNTVDDNLENIFKVFLDNAQMSKYSGGIATDWTNIRSTGALIKTVNISSQGVIPFLKIANDVTVAIARSGRRIGATCVYLENWHLDFEDFMELRKGTGDDRRRTHDMNTAAWISDLFMKRVAEDGPWTYFSPEEVPELHHLYGKAFEKKYVEYEKKAAEGKIVLHKTVSAVSLYRKMLTMLFETGHPWITFKDPSNIRSPQDHVGVVHNSNLCTEITLNNSTDETAVCNLGSVNLPRHFRDGQLDRELIADTVTTAMRMLDNVIDINLYVTKETKTSNMLHRPVGLGIMGFQDALYLLDINFESDKAVKFADESMELISYYAILGSSHLAREKGAYKTFKGSKWDRGIFPVDTIALLEKERGVTIDVDRKSTLDWKPVREHVRKYGMRNSNTMAIAPTASISNIVGAYPCIEPIYKNLYVKSNMSGDFTVINSYLIDDLKKVDLWSDEMVQRIKVEDGSIQKITEIPAKIRAKYKEVFEIDATWLIKIAAFRGKWIDQSQSLNIFVSGVSGKKLADIYQYAWTMGLKTTYYLRSLAASQVEKSTIDTAKHGQTHTRDHSDLSLSQTQPSIVAQDVPADKEPVS